MVKIAQVSIGGIQSVASAGNGAHCAGADQANDSEYGDSGNLVPSSTSWGMHFDAPNWAPYVVGNYSVPDEALSCVDMGTVRFDLPAGEFWRELF